MKCHYQIHCLGANRLISVKLVCPLYLNFESGLIYNLFLIFGKERSASAVQIHLEDEGGTFS
jgi:hypothetical protein